jgi:hypothetical protein
MSQTTITLDEFLDDAQGRTFADVVGDSRLPFADVLAFFNAQNRQRRLEDSELHHDRPPMSGVVRELESQAAVDRYLAEEHPRRSQRLRQAIGVLVRMIMERRGWRKTGRKGSLGVRAAHLPTTPNHNTGGLAFWFLRAERYERVQGMPYLTVAQRCKEIKPSASPPSPTSEEAPQSTNGNSVSSPSRKSGRRKRRE